ncbi:MAG: hypothetical protein IJV41_02830 [Oscillospiraceae bacterium]|nr:hypothetical protein [Oscillospiraceae bacterium]
MSNQVFKVVLLQALPASGKSEVRNFMANVEAERLKNEFHIGANLQLDDFPYVHMMRRIDNELEAMGQARIFYPGEEPFTDGRDWGTLCNLLNEDYHDLLNRVVVKPDSAAEYLFARIDRAGAGAGIKPRLGLLDEGVRAKLAAILEKEARGMLDEKQAAYPDSFEDKTIIIECARGGPDGSAMPLTGTFGYQYSLPMFCPEILENAVILYIWVTPEESRRKNADRADPNDPGSNLHHGVPMAVMLGDYGCDDMEYLREHSKANCVSFEAHGKHWDIPIGVFDNRVDKTSFLRATPDQWDADKVANVTAAIRAATDAMYENYKK